MQRPSCFQDVETAVVSYGCITIGKPCIGGHRHISTSSDSLATHLRGFTNDFVHTDYARSVSVVLHCELARRKDNAPAPMTNNSALV